MQRGGPPFVRFLSSLDTLSFPDQEADLFVRFCSRECPQAPQAGFGGAGGGDCYKVRLVFPLRTFLRPAD